VKEHSLLVAFELNPAQRDLQHQATPAFIGDDKIAAAAKHKERQMTRSSVGYCLLYVVQGVGLSKKARRTTYVEGSQPREGNIFLDDQGVGKDYLSN
jgi:hypothetical protein